MWGFEEYSARYHILNLFLFLLFRLWFKLPAFAKLTNNQIFDFPVQDNMVGVSRYNIFWPLVGIALFYLTFIYILGGRALFRVYLAEV